RPNNTHFAVLGVLALQAGSGYDIKKFLGRSIGHFWKVSYGQVYPILKELAAGGLATMTRESQHKRPTRNVYSITDRGREYLQRWLESPLDIQSNDASREVLLRIFFGEFAPADVNIRQVEQLQQFVKRGGAIYPEIAERLNRDEIGNRHLPYWLLTLKMGMFNCKAILRWCDESLATLQQLNK
ncbi:MAG: PadR family transcriptional regulator, partial [Candidatus Neomarinimicrobiota bacterium]